MRTPTTRATSTGGQVGSIPSWTRVAARLSAPPPGAMGRTVGGTGERSAPGAVLVGDARAGAGCVPTRPGGKSMAVPAPLKMASSGPANPPGTFGRGGCIFEGAFVVKVLGVRLQGLPGWVLPVAGGLVFTALVGLFLTSSVWFFTSASAPRPIF